MGAAFKEDKSVFCPKHQNYWDVKDNANNTDFSLDRLVHIDVEAELKKKPKWVDLRTVQCYIGSLKVQLLGKINLDLSDNSQALIPIGKKHALKKYDQFTPNTRCFWGRYRIKYYPSCAISRNFCYKNNG